MNIILRPGQPADANACGIICYEAFKSIAGQHGFPPDFPNPETAIGMMNYILSNSTAWSLIAEKDGQIVGSNFLWEDTSIAGVGPITIDPKTQNASVGRKLMEGVLQRVEEQGLAGVRLVQAAYHNRSLSLYAKLGFEVKEPLSVLQGQALIFICQAMMFGLQKKLIWTNATSYVIKCTDITGAVNFLVPLRPEQLTLSSATIAFQGTQPS